ncbi:MAG: sulfate ABC transporter permease subunit CysT [Treponema sp.]|nr:sulfate ABC transporter permease subunit CysT [Treponema sp.]
MPGFGLTLGLSLTYMTLLIFIPLSALLLYAARMPLGKLAAALWDPRTLAAFKVSLGSALCAAGVNCCFGLAAAWALNRYQFWGKRIVDACIDLPFAIPTAVAGISLATVFSPQGLLGGVFRFFGADIGFSQAGIVIALVFTGLPFVVRTVQPVLEAFDWEQEEAAASLGAGYGQIFIRVIFPSILPALLTGAAMAFARGLGEYGSIIFIASNMPYESEIVPLLIVKKLMQFDYVGASVIGAAMLAAAFVMLFITNALQQYLQKRSSL